MFPYTQAVAEEFANNTGNEAPVVESTGTGGGMKIFCGGVGEGTPDVTGASRAMKKSEWELCQKNGVTKVTEVLIGYDGLSMAVSRQGRQLDLTKEQIFKALASEVPIDGKLVANPYTKWSEVDASLPDIKIQVFGPPPTSGTRDAFVELAMHKGCKSLDFFKAKKAELDKKAFKKYVKANCSRMRQDGPFIEAGENDNLIVQQVSKPTPDRLWHLRLLVPRPRTPDRIQPVKPDLGRRADLREASASGEYGISRPPLLLRQEGPSWVWSPGIGEYIAEYHERRSHAAGEDGYLAEQAAS